MYNDRWEKKSFVLTRKCIQFIAIFRFPTTRLLEIRIQSIYDINHIRFVITLNKYIIVCYVYNCLLRVKNQYMIISNNGQLLSIDF